MVYANTAQQPLPDLSGRMSARVRSYLAAFVSELAGFSSRSYQWQLMIIVGDGLEIHRIIDRKAERMATLERLDDRTLADIKQCLSSVSEQRIGLRFCSDRAVTRLIYLPGSARNIITEIVQNKVETLAPWPLGEALWGFRQSPVSSGADQIMVEVGIIGRHMVEGFLRSLARIGIKIDHLDIGNSTSPNDGIQLDFGNETKTERIRKTVMAAAICFGFAAAAMGILGAYLAVAAFSELNQMEAQAARISSALNNSSNSDKPSEFSEARKLIERKRADQPAIRILDALTQAIPDGAWLESIDYQDRHVTMSGRGTSIPSIVEALERSEVFSKVNIAAATQRDLEANVDQFSISASVEPPRNTK